VNRCGLLVTNAHVITKSEPDYSGRAFFDANGRIQDCVLRPDWCLFVNPVPEVKREDGTWLDVAIVAVDLRSLPAAPSTIPLSLPAKSVESDTCLAVVGHPIGGGALKLSLGAPIFGVQKEYIDYTADTEYGSSGE
jgi:hypothetical protein